MASPSAQVTDLPLSSTQRRLAAQLRGLVGKAIADYDPLFLEEPTPPESIAAVANVRAHVPVRIATGERYYDKQQFQDLVTRNAADWIHRNLA